MKFLMLFFVNFFNYFFQSKEEELVEEECSNENDFLLLDAEYRYPLSSIGVLYLYGNGTYQVYPDDDTRFNESDIEHIVGFDFIGSDDEILFEESSGYEIEFSFDEDEDTDIKYEMRPDDILSIHFDYEINGYVFILTMSDTDEAKRVYVSKIA